MSRKRPDPEILFGRIALMLNYISTAQLTECVVYQERSHPHKKLGMVMLEKGFIDREQLEEIIRVQQANLQAPSAHPEQRLEDTITGRLIVKMGLATEEQVNEALRKQALAEQDGSFYRLGEVMVEKGFMSVEDVLKVLNVQDKRIMVCPGCGSRFNVASFQPGHTYKCKRCKTLLAVPAALESVQVDTTIFLTGDTGAGDETASSGPAGAAEEDQHPREQPPKAAGETEDIPRFDPPGAQPSAEPPDGQGTTLTDGS